MKRCTLITLAVGALVIGYNQLPFTTKGKLVGWFGGDDSISVTRAPVKRELVPHLVRGRGQLQAVEVVNLFSPVAGQLSKIQLKVGDRVSKGQILATVRSHELEQRLQKVAVALGTAKENLWRKESHLAEAEKALERARELYSRDLIPGRDLQEAEAARATARAQHTLAHAQVVEQQAALEQARYLLSVSKLVAPFDGVVTGMLAESGAYVHTLTPVFSLGAMEPLKVVIEIPETDVDFVRDGVVPQVRADALPDRAFEGRATFLDSRLEPTQSVIVEVRIATRDRLLVPGMNVEVILVQKSGQ